MPTKVRDFSDLYKVSREKTAESGGARTSLLQPQPYPCLFRATFELLLGEVLFYGFS